MIVDEASLYPNSFIFKVGKLYLVEKHAFFHSSQEACDFNIYGGNNFEYKFNDIKARIHVAGKIITPDDVEYVVAANNIILCVEIGKETEKSKKFNYQTIKILYKDKIGWTGFPRNHEASFFSER